MTTAQLSRVEDLSQEESLSFATQVQGWFATGWNTFQDAARNVLRR